MARMERPLVCGGVLEGLGWPGLGPAFLDAPPGGPCGGEPDASLASRRVEWGTPSGGSTRRGTSAVAMRGRAGLARSVSGTPPVAAAHWHGAGGGSVGTDLSATGSWRAPGPRADGSHPGRGRVSDVAPAFPTGKVPKPRARIAAVSAPFRMGQVPCGRRRGLCGDVSLRAGPQGAMDRGHGPGVGTVRGAGPIRDGLGQPAGPAVSWPGGACLSALAGSGWPLARLHPTRLDACRGRHGPLDLGPSMVGR